MRVLVYTLCLAALHGPADAKPAQESWWLTIQAYWLPMCFFFDAAVAEADANRQIRGLAKAYSACGIHLKPFAFTLRSDYPRDTEALRALSARACPFLDIFQTRGAVQMRIDDPTLPGRMCRRPGANGCSTLCEPQSFSMLAPAADPTIALHESLHSNCCGPVCVDAGQGSGLAAGPGLELALKGARQTTLAASTPLREEQISPAACAALRAGAASNEISSWRAQENEVYYRREVHVEKQYDLSAGVSFFSGKAPRPASEVKPPPKPKVLITSVTGEMLLENVRADGDSGEDKAPPVSFTMVDGSFRNQLWRVK